MNQRRAAFSNSIGSSTISQFSGLYSISLNLTPPSRNDDDAEMHAVGRFLAGHAKRKNFKGVDLLPYHKMGVGKYAQLDMEYPIKDNPVLDDRDMATMESILRGYDLDVKTIRH